MPSLFMKTVHWRSASHTVKNSSDA